MKLGQFGPNLAETEAEAEFGNMAEFGRGRGQGRGLGRFLVFGVQDNLSGGRISRYIQGFKTWLLKTIFFQFFIHFWSDQADFRIFGSPRDCLPTLKISASYLLYFSRY